MQNLDNWVNSKLCQVNHFSSTELKLLSRDQARPQSIPGQCVIHCPDGIHRSSQVCWESETWKLSSVCRVPVCRIPCCSLLQAQSPVSEWNSHLIVISSGCCSMEIWCSDITKHAVTRPVDCSTAACLPMSVRIVMTLGQCLSPAPSGGRLCLARITSC